MGGECGCGLYFCEEHLSGSFEDLDDPDGRWYEVCERCAVGDLPFDPKPDTDEWNQWKLTDESWQRWRDENLVEVAKISPE